MKKLFTFILVFSLTISLLAVGQIHAVATGPHLVISQIYGGGGATAGSPAYKNDYIELYNPTDNAVSLDGWSVQYASSAGQSWSVTTLSGTIEAHSFFLIVEAGSSLGADVSGDFGGTIAMSATSGKVALVQATAALSGTNPAGTGSVVDFVGYGTAANGYEGSAPTATLNNTTAAWRETAGVIADTDNNGADIVVRAAMPRNAAYTGILASLTAAIDVEIGTDRSASSYILAASDYSPATWETYINALSAAISTEVNSLATQSEIQNAVTSLAAAKAGLSVEKTALTASITAEIGLNHASPVYVLTQIDYSASSWTAYTAAISAAVSVESDSTATQAQVDSATAAITTAKVGLGVDKSALTVAITSEIGTDHASPVYVLTQADYSTASWTSFTAAITAAMSVESDNAATQAQFDSATAAIAAAKAGLESVTVNGITIKTTPTITEYISGSALNLSGLVVTLNLSNSTTEDVSLADFAANCITTNPANGTILTSCISVAITANGHSVTQAIAVYDSDTYDPTRDGTVNVGTQSNSVIATINTSSGGSVTERQLTQAIQEAKKAADSNQHIGIVIQTHESYNCASSVNIPASAFDLLAAHGINYLTVSTPLGTTRFDEIAINSLAEHSAAGKVNVTINEVDLKMLPAGTDSGNHPVFSASVTVNGSPITEFGRGTLKISVPYILTTSEDPNDIVIYYVSSNGELVLIPKCVYDPATGTVMFTTTHLSMYAVGYRSVNFTDISGWYFDYVNYLAARGIMNGAGNGIFNPDGNITRAEFVTILANLSGASLSGYTPASFSDVKTTDWFFGAVEWTYTNGITEGADGKFNPNSFITRQDIAVMLTRYAERIGFSIPQTTDTKPFADSDAIAGYAADSVEVMQTAGIISGRPNGSFAPTDGTTRAEAAKMIALFIKLLVS